MVAQLLSRFPDWIDFDQGAAHLRRIAHDLRCACSMFVERFNALKIKALMCPVGEQC
jgi:hypothetical protein